jgi:AcrR family transcriptional regulator
LPRKTSYHHGNLKPALLTAALRELAREGVEGFSLRGVARRAGVSAPAVYRHFRDKDALLAAVAADCADRLATTIKAAVASATDDDPLERFRTVGIAIVQFAVANPEHYRALTIPGLAARATPEQRAEEDAWNAAQRASLAAAQAKGLIADVPLDALLLTANCAVNGLAHSIISGSLGPVDEARGTQLAIALTRVLGHGFAPRNEPLTDPRKGDRG